MTRCVRSRAPPPVEAAYAVSERRPEESRTACLERALRAAYAVDFPGVSPASPGALTVARLAGLLCETLHRYNERDAFPGTHPFPCRSAIHFAERLLPKLGLGAPP